MPRPGDIRERVDLKPGHVARVVVVSNEIYTTATGFLFVCPVYPDDGGMGEHPMVVRLDIGGQAAFVLPDDVYRMPASGLANDPLAALSGAALEQIRVVLRGVFSDAYTAG